MVVLAGRYKLIWRFEHKFLENCEVQVKQTENGRNILGVDNKTNDHS